jgi:FKBP-type peptidyl-prolyl cis-trans isomerase
MYLMICHKIGVVVGGLLLGCACLSGQALEVHSANSPIRSRIAAQALSNPREFPAPADVAEPVAGAKQFGGGLATEVLRAGSGITHPMGNDCAEVRFIAWKRDGSLAAASGPHGESAVECLSVAITGIAVALASMVTGEKRRVWVPAEFSGINHVAHHAGHIMHLDDTPRTDLTFDLELIRILPAPPTPQNLSKPPRTAVHLPSGVVIQMLKRGIGNGHPAVNSRVKVNYTGWTADGKVFESTVMSQHLATFLLGTALPGWREALQQMSSGEKARLWIPAELAYGDHPANHSFPAGPLVYDLELIEFQ